MLEFGMGLQQFNADVAAAGAGEKTFKCITHVRRGDSEGEVVFTYSHGQLKTPLDIQALLMNDITTYPRDSAFIVFTGSGDVDKKFDRFFDGLRSHTKEKTVQGVIEVISDRLTAMLEARYTPEIDLGDNSGSSSQASDFDDEAFGDFDEEEFEMKLDLRLRKEPTTDLEFSPDPTSQRRLRRDLRAAKQAGLVKRVLSSTDDHAKGIFSLAIRVSKLGIQEDTLEAWGLNRSEYIVLLLRFPMGYPSASRFFQLPSDQMAVQFRFGKCSVAKPSYETARQAFVNASPKRHGSEEGDVTGADAPQAAPDAFFHMYMFGSINDLLNKELPKLIFIRRAQNLSWDGAQECRFRNATGETEQQGQDNPTASLDSPAEDDGPLITPKAPQSLQYDHAMDAAKDFNLPLVAMQYALRRFARCTQYCTICHSKIQEGFESVKPYVCSKPLCLYQYITLGFGPSIEHEIINNPYVVDLLISFFFAASSDHRHRESPRGLNLKTAVIGPVMDPAEHILAQAQFKSKRIKFELKDFAAYKFIKKGHWVVLVVAPQDYTARERMLKYGLEQHVCRITDTGAEFYSFEIISDRLAQENVLLLPEDVESSHANNPTDDWVSIQVFQFNRDVDELDVKEHDDALMFLANAIPSVLEMKSWLLERPGRPLASWERMDASVYTLLNWIVASNRSYIVQDGAIPGQSPGASSDKPAGEGNKVTGVPDGWMQFRFVQGSPEKEQQFARELKTASQLDHRRERYPTMFVWHGSPLGNWHSIIRTGLDFATVLHGRSSGHGVYFSSNIKVSSGYLGGGPNWLTRPETSVPVNHWRNSQLKISAAISACEIINRPEDFVSSRPHWVINKVDWIQCRYLFVHANPTTAAKDEPVAKPSAGHGLGYFEQDPERRLQGLSEQFVEIPLSTQMAARQGAHTTAANESASAAPILDDPSSSEDAYSDDEIDDVDWGFNSDDAADGSNKSGKRRRRSSDDSMLKSSVSAKLDNASHDRKRAGEGARLATPVDQTMMDQSTTEFKPGSLDYNSIPQLPEPSWASSSSSALRRVQRDVKDMQKTQSETGTRALGWYIDFDRMTNGMANIFHWIVELHSFDDSLPLARDMADHGCTSIVLELRFGPEYPMSPPFVRVIRPRFLPFTNGGGGHVTGGGAICSELLTNSGWSPALTVEKVLLEVRMNLCDMDPPARLQSAHGGSLSAASEYGIGEALAAYRRSTEAHGWTVPDDVAQTAAASWA